MAGYPAYTMPPQADRTTGLPLPSSQTMKISRSAQKFGDLNKLAKDLFTKDFDFGEVKLEAKTKSLQNVEFKATGSRNSSTGGILGTLEITNVLDKHGIKFVEKWTTASELSVEASVTGLHDGLKITSEGNITPLGGSVDLRARSRSSHADAHGGRRKRAVKLSAEYVQANVAAVANVDVFAGPTVTGSVVLGYARAYAYACVIMGCGSPRGGGAHAARTRTVQSRRLHGWH